LSYAYSYPEFDYDTYAYRNTDRNSYTDTD
jgi:hypothetical protein